MDPLRWAVAVDIEHDPSADAVPQPALDFDQRNAW
jgi:hypothetical protein